ncbi:MULTISPECIES: hypothetical protein [unclassified Niallia]|uniref:hypothetical protein n=1 Tax=unclassified Niallia TaxID=2837522 RepID=UPI00203FF7AC|nr:hypothetical protein [Niallia sp. MER 6]MCM3030387.1 hypothetical protein [Niallia sp. MER 6]
MARSKKEEVKDYLEIQQAEEPKETTNNELVEEIKEEEKPKKGYVVVHDFRDLKDNNTIYIKGDIYPRRADAVVEEDRINELASTKNNIRKVLIKEQD